MKPVDVILRAGPMSLSLRPGWGGRVVFFAHAEYGDILTPISETSFDPETWPKGGAYPLIPFHNRVSNGEFTFDGIDIKLPSHLEAWPHALHGFSSRRPWRLEGCNDVQSTMRLDHASDDAWPFALSAMQSFRLSEDCLEVVVSVTNTGESAMPAGIGWHPYFALPSAITHDAKVFWPINADFRPTGQTLRREAMGGQTQYLSQWSKCDLALASGLRLRMTVGPDLSHLVIHKSAAGYACVEPVSHLTDALANAPEGTENGMRRLAPGETLASKISLKLTGKQKLPQTARSKTFQTEK